MADTAAKIMVLCFPFGQPAPEICELGVKCNEKAGFPGSGFSRQGEIAPEETENEIPKKICTFMYESGSQTVEMPANRMDGDSRLTVAAGSRVEGIWRSLEDA